MQQQWGQQQQYPPMQQPQSDQSRQRMVSENDMRMFSVGNCQIDKIAALEKELYIEKFMNDKK